MNAGDCPTVPTLYTLSTRIFQISLPFLMRSSSLAPNEARNRSNARNSSGSSGFLPEAPFEAYQRA